MQAMERILLPAPPRLVVAALLLWGMTCLAQESTGVQETKVIVADVIPQGSRKVSAQQIMAYIKTRPGSEYKQEVIQEDVRTLYRTKQFANIEVVPRTEADGRVTVFFLIRDYPSKVENVVYKGAKHLKDDELTALTNIRKGTLLNPAANKLACQGIVRKYNELGRIFASCQLLKGDQPGDTEVVFDITEGPRVRVRSIRYAGADTLVGGLFLFAYFNTVPMALGLVDGTFNPHMLETKIARLEEYYKAFGYLDVRIARELQYTPDGGEVDIVFHIHEGIHYKVKDVPQVSDLKSIPPEQPEQLKLTKLLKIGHQPDIEGDISRIKDYWGPGHEVQGRVPPPTTTEPSGLVNVQYEFEERQQNPGVHVRSVRIVGGDGGVVDSVLAGNLNTWWKILWLFGQENNSQSLPAAIARLEECYKGFGYPDVRIRHELQFTYDGQEGEVVFHIHKGNWDPAKADSKAIFSFYMGFMR